MSETKEKKVDMTQSWSGSTREIKNAFPSSNFENAFPTFENAFPRISKIVGNAFPTFSWIFNNFGNGFLIFENPFFLFFKNFIVIF